MIQPVNLQNRWHYKLPKLLFAKQHFERYETQPPFKTQDK